MVGYPRRLSLYDVRPATFPAPARGGNASMPVGPTIYRRYSPTGELQRETTNFDELFDPGELEQISRNIAAAEAQKAGRDTTTRTAQETSSTQSGPLTQAQRAMAVGDPVPVVFARRRTGGTGGVLVLPRATEAQFSSSDGNNLTARYHCILSDGQVSGVQVRDVRKGNVREGSFSQNYNQRAGEWSPGNRLANLQNIKASDYPLQCGGGGDYRGVTTIEFSSVHPFNSDRWKQTWSAFVRGGINVTRVYDNTAGPSDNIVDLVYWALVNSGRMNASQIDSAQMLKAATFIEQNQLYCNGVFETRTSLPDFLLGILPAFLLRETTIDGKFALAPIPRTNANGTLFTGRLIPDWILTEEVIQPGSVEISPAPAATTLPLEIAVGWRQQTSDVHPPLDRDLIIGVSTDVLPTREEWDLRGVCTSEAHAALVGGWRHAARTIGAATARVTLLRGAHTGYLRQGQIVHLYLQVITELQQAGQISGYWFVDAVSLTPDGSEALELSACPVDGEGRSLLTLRALAFQAAAPGILLPYPEIGVDDVAGRAADSSVPAPTTNPTIIPFSGGGGAPQMTSGFNRTSLPPAGPSSSPPEPPSTGDADGGVVEADAPLSTIPEAGRKPTEPNNENKGPKTYEPWGDVVLSPPIEGIPPKCFYGNNVSVVNISGMVSLGGPGITSYTATIYPPVVKRAMSEAELIVFGGSPSFEDDGVTYYVTWYELSYDRAVAILDGTGEIIGYQSIPETNYVGDSDWENDLGVAGTLDIFYDDLTCKLRPDRGAEEP